MTELEQRAERLHDYLGAHVRVGGEVGRCMGVEARIIRQAAGERVHFTLSLRQPGRRNERHVRGWLGELVIERVAEERAA